MEIPMIAPASRRLLVAAAFAAVAVLSDPLPASSAAPPDSVDVPLHVFRVSRQTTKIGIELRLGGGPARLYELDTGAAGFYAAYNEAWWPTFTPLPDGSITQMYASGVEYEAKKVSTTVVIPSDQGDIAAELEVAQITDGFGGPLGPQEKSKWNADVARGVPPLYGHFFGNFGSDLRSEKGLFAVLPQLPGNLSSGFIVALGCDGRGDPKLVIGLTDANRARFTTLVAMQAGADATFPHSGLPTYAQQLIDAQFLLSRRGTVQSFTTGAILDTGAPTTTVHEFGDTVIDPALVAGPIVKPATYFSVTADGVGAKGDFALAFLTGQISGVNEVELTPDTGSYVNLGLIPFFRYDVMFDVERGVVGFAPCHRTSTRRRLPIIESRPAS